MQLRPDFRHMSGVFDAPNDRHVACRKCGRELVILPEDRRHGYCFDCTDLLDSPDKFERDDGRTFFPGTRNFFYR
ncbi:MAG: scaffold protein involved in DNA repair [Candidatus Dadabacteria bacterium]|nr:scaffold protein involved in DNA repair [Candidatus Dadabacteria bacterium]